MKKVSIITPEEAALKVQEDFPVLHAVRRGVH